MIGSHKQKGWGVLTASVCSSFSFVPANTILKVLAGLPDCLAISCLSCATVNPGYTAIMYDLPLKSFTTTSKISCSWFAIFLSLVWCVYRNTRKSIRLLQDRRWRQKPVTCHYITGKYVHLFGKVRVFLLGGLTKH